MTRGKRIGYALMVLSIACGAGSLALFAARPIGVLSVRLHWPESLLLPWDALLSFAFFLQHSGMVRAGFQARLSAVIPPAYHRAIYSIASGIALAGVVLLWQPSSIHLLVLGGAYRWVARVAVLLAIGVFIWGAVAVRDLDFFGLKSIRSYLQHSAPHEPVFLVRGPYRWVRHPWYFGVLVLIWSCTDVTADRLLFNVLWTAWVCVGTKLEERDLMVEFGDAYARYRQKVPMLIPWRGPIGE
jgi:methanethiol S-methyltransferase